MVRKIVLSLIAVFVFLAYATAQNRQISGTVSDANGHPVAGATVIVDGTSLGTTTNTAGEYTLSAPVNGTLVVTFVGFEPQQLPIAGKTRINVTMKEDAQAIDDVIVVAFGTAKKEAFTGSAAVIKSDEIAKVQTSNVATALVGRVAGVQTSSTSGDLGKTPSIRVRGFGSINAGKEPLWIVDGMPYEGDLNNLNTNDIESMTVLKDAASNALYGARGANGVIMVTTKKAKSGDAVVTIDAKWGVNSKALEEYDVITSPAQYYETHFKALYGYYAQTNPAAKAYALASSGLTSNGTGGLGYNVYTVPEGQALIGTNGKLNPNATLGRKIIYNGQEYWLTPDDWIDEAYQSAFRQEYNVNISGATERSSFYASLGYLDNTGIIKSSALERYTARLKADYQAKKWLKVGGNMSYAHFSNSNGNSNEGSASSTANIFAFSARMPPIYPVYIRDGSGRIMVDDNGYQMYDYGDKGNAGLTRPLLPGANGLQTSWLNKKKAEGNAFSGSGFVDISLYKGLKLTVNGSTNIDETRTTYLNNQYYGQFAEAGGTISKYHTRDIAYNLQQILNYNETFGKHNVGLMVGHEYYQKKYYYLSGTKSKLFSYDNEELGGAVVDGAGAHSYIDDYNSEGYFMRAQYDYAGRYFVSGSYRRDASSRFHPDHRWGNFWSVGAAWLLNQENWFDAPWVNMLKLKASYGSQGNDNIGNYLYTDTYSIENNNGEIAVLFGQKGNPNITWETNTNLNIGTEFGFWNNRLSGSVDFFNRKTSDMLFAFSVPSSLGYSSYYANVGDMVNRGVEVELNADLIRTKNVLWSFNLNLTHVKNEVTYLAPEHKSTTVEGYKGYIDGSYFVGEGLPLYTYYLRSYAGVDPETGASLWYKDVKGDDGKITRTKTSDYTSATRYLHDSAIPSVYGGFSTSVSAYGVDFSISFNYQIGGKVYDSGYASFMSSPYGTTVGTNYHKDILKAWTPENKGSDIPRLQYGDQYTTSVSDRFLTDASYLNISNINVGYTLPSKITQKFGVQKLRVYLACDNVVYWSKRQGLDPRYSFTGATNFSNYSPIRTISGGVTVQF
ncbi:TonB-dependent receptor [Alistipes sp.]|uniref:SusC/RagA family TonB-linked outer membrane protein n=1 Tax=Alistipes sp. TaxID=1872444 RepID=UPI0023F0F77B|nr:TonB-dependent receptor [Alistipes sp.]MBS6299043.1 TonB-dependent receptor [Alistipes sp.]